MICVAASFISGSSEGRNCSSGLAAIKPCTAAATTGAARKGEIAHLAVVKRSGSGAANGISAWGCSEKKERLRRLRRENLHREPAVHPEESEEL